MQSISKRPIVQLSTFRLVSAAAVCATLLAASVANAQDVVAPPSSEAPPVAALSAPAGVHFGQPGQWFLEALTFWTPAGNFGGNASDVSLSWSSAAGSSTGFNLNIQPVAGYFFTDVIFGRLGFDITYNSQFQDASLGAGSVDNFGIGIEPGVGIAIPVAARTTFAPWIGLNYLYNHYSASGSSVNRSRLNLEVHVPLVVEIVEHFGFTAGVYYAQGLVDHASADGESTDGAKIGTVGLTSGLLGYW